MQGFAFCGPVTGLALSCFSRRRKRAVPLRSDWRTCAGGFSSAMPTRQRRLGARPKTVDRPQATVPAPPPSPMVAPGRTGPAVNPAHVRTCGRRKWRGFLFGFDGPRTMARRPKLFRALARCMASRGGSTWRFSRESMSLALNERIKRWRGISAASWRRMVRSDTSDTRL